MADDFASVTVTPPAAPVRDERRMKEFVVRMNKAIPAIEAVAAVAAVAAVEADEEEGIEAVAAVAAVTAVEAVAAVRAGTRVVEIEIRYTNFSSTDEKTDANPDGVLSQDGANLYKKSANVTALKGKLFKAGAKAEIEARLAEDNIDA